MIEIDGAQHSGSGTIVRYSAALAALRHTQLCLTNIRAKREKPGLRPQHLRALEALRELTQGSLEGIRVGAQEIFFQPGQTIQGGQYIWDIGTAGSTTMLAFTLLPVAAFACEPSVFQIAGGLFQDFAPSAYHMKYCLLPTLEKMGLHASIEILRPGYPPKGGGLIRLEVSTAQRLQPVVLTEGWSSVNIKGIALSSHLEDRQVSERMARACKKALKARGYNAEIQIVPDNTAFQAGAALAIFADTDHDTILGADMAGRLGRRSEEIGRTVAQMLMEDLETGSSVDRYLADQLILYAALACGKSRFKIPRVTEHVETNLWLVETILGAKVELRDSWVDVQGVSYERAQS
ncbi:MAG: RNA 3'-terminal phosphate cyclase [Candidatus Binatia bacterium]